MFKNYDILRSEVDSLSAEILELRAQVTDLQGEIASIKASLDDKIRSAILYAQSENLKSKFQKEPVENVDE